MSTSIHFRLKHLGTSLSLLLGITLGQPLLADDVEVYLTPSVRVIPPNVLFVLDESLSMTWDMDDPHGRSRMQVLQDTLTDLVGDDEMHNISMAFLGFTADENDIDTTELTAISDDFKQLNDTTQGDFIGQIRTLSTGVFTPTVAALESAVNWFRTDKTFTDHNDHTMTSPFQTAAGSGSSNGIWCQPNRVILLSDGEPNANSKTSYEDTVCDTVRFPATPVNANGTCAKEIAHWAYTHDLDTAGNWEGEQHLVTDVIGFTVGENAENFLRSVASEGGGTYYSADTADALATAFRNSLSNAQTSVEYAYTAPVIPFNQNNAAVSGDKIYIPLFVPDNAKFWKGNLKSFNIATVTSGDSTSISITGHGGTSVIDEDYEFQDVQDNWSSTSDDADPLTNGAAAHMHKGQDNTIRKLYTDLGGDNTTLSGSGNRVNKTNITPGMLGLAEDDTDTRDNLINWITWDWTAPTPADGEQPEESHEGVMGAPLHTRPAFVDYADGDVIYLPTTEGVLEAIDEQTGKELWAYMPSELLHNIITIKNNNESEIPYYGIDGPMTTYSIGNQKYLIFGMRRGGKSYYLLNITSRAEPKLIKRIYDVDPSNSGDVFDGLGQTWSKPLLTKVYHNSGLVNVLVFGGGYDTDEDEATIRSNDDEGNVIFIVNATTGALVQKISSTTPNVDGMNYAIASDVLPFDINRNGILDRIYAADVGGQIIRIDIPETDEGSLSGGVIADMSGDTESTFRRFFNTPEVGYYNRNGIQYFAILIGSGNHTSPLETAVTDSFFMIKDRNVWARPETYTAVAFDDLYDATNNLVQDGDADQRSAAANSMNTMSGWRIDLENGAEKTFSRAVLYNYAVLFTTYSATRDNSQDPCESQGASGVSRFYAINMINGAAMFGNMDGDSDTLNKDDRSKILNINAIPPTPSLLFPGNDGGRLGSVIKAMVGLEEVTEWPMQLIPITWEEVINE